MSVDKLLLNKETNNVELHMQLDRLKEANLSDVIATLSKSRYANSLFEPEHMRQALETARQNEKDPAVIIIGKIFDAELTITIEDGGLEAVAELKPARGGKTLTPADVAKAFAKAGIKHGLNPKSIDLLSEHSSKKNGGARKVRCTIAKATLPVYGKSGKIEQLTPTLKDRVLRPKVAGAGKVDPRDFGAIISVSEGDPLLRRVPAVQGKEGTTVTGNPITPPPVEDHELKPDEGSDLLEGDENVLIATRLGIPVLTETGMKVVDTLELEAVNNYTGHIEYEGNVVVKNDVAEGMRINVGGDVLVMGNVEGCTIEAQGDVTLEKGAYGQFGNDTTTNCHISAKGDVVIGLAQNIQVEAVGNIHIRKQAQHCIFTAQDSLYIGLQEPNEGTLIGGKIKVGKGFYCGELGAPAGVPTEIDLSLAYNKVMEELDEAKQEVIEAQEAMAELAKERALLQDQIHKPGIQAQLDMANSFYLEQRKVTEAKQANVQTVNSKLSRAAEAVQVIASKKAFSGLEFSLGTQWALTTTRDYGPSRIFYSGNSLQLEPWTFKK